MRAVRGHPCPRWRCFLKVNTNLGPLHSRRRHGMLYRRHQGFIVSRRLMATCLIEETSDEGSKEIPKVLNDILLNEPCTPNLGQGGCMALEDALVLAKCVGKGISLETALRRYESVRYSRSRHIQKRSLMMGHIGQWENRFIVGGRRVVTNLLPARLFEHNLRRVYAYEI